MTIEHSSVLKVILEQVYDRFEETLKDLTVQEANLFLNHKRDADIRSVTWLTWHTARNLDLQISYLSGSTPLYIIEGWDKKFPFDVELDENGWAHRSYQAHKIVSVNNEITLGYLRRSVNLAILYIEGLSENSLKEIVDNSWAPPVTREIRLASIIGDSLMHSGQAIYTKRLLAIL